MYWWLWLPIELPLAGLSFAFYRGARFVLRRVYNLYFVLFKARATRWRVTGASLLQNPLALPVIMTTGPRWNTPAITASVGPLAVRESLAIYVRLAQKSADAWTIVVYSFPDHRTVATLNPPAEPLPSDWQTIVLPPGRYTLILRYYHWHATVELPAVTVDGAASVPVCLVPADNNAFLRQLAGRCNLFYLGLHAYVYPMLRLRRWLPSGFVQREFLPVGNPETAFLYGALPRGRALECRFDDTLWAGHDVYLTCYNRCSFPVLWYHLTEQQHTTPPAPDDGFYLFRLHRKPGIPELSDISGTTITVVQAQRAKR